MFMFNKGTQEQNASQSLQWDIGAGQEKVATSQTWVFSAVVSFEVLSCCVKDIKI